MKKSLVLITTAFSMLLLVACSQQGVTKSNNKVDSNVIQGSKVLEDYTYLNKEIVSLEDTEKLFKQENIKLVKKELEKSDFSILQQKYPVNYYIDNDKNQMLRIYVFASENERVKARKEYDGKTASMSMKHCKIYEAKNILVFLIAGDASNQYYQKISLIAQKINSKQGDVRDVVWNQLTPKDKERINGTWQDGKLYKRILNKDMGIINDKTYINKEIYIVDFPTKNFSMPNNMLVFASLSDYKIIGYGYVD
jgi:hypothetical protein